MSREVEPNKLTILDSHRGGLTLTMLTFVSCGTELIVQLATTSAALPSLGAPMHA